jgi:hypothetical protein
MSVKWPLNVHFFGAINFRMAPFIHRKWGHWPQLLFVLPGTAVTVICIFFAIKSNNKCYLVLENILRNLEKYIASTCYSEIKIKNIRVLYLRWFYLISQIWYRLSMYWIWTKTVFWLINLWNRRTCLICTRLYFFKRLLNL